MNGEVWLPARFAGKGAARFLLFVNFTGSEEVNMSNYRKFKATLDDSAGVSTVENGRVAAVAVRSSLSRVNLP